MDYRRHASILASLLLAGTVTSGCLEKENTNTLCLEPDGSVTWTVTDRDVHATGDTPADRQREEDAYLANARLGEHAAARAFRVLHAFDVRTDVLRDEWPFAVQVRGDFPDLATLWQDILGELGMSGRSHVEREGSQTTWTLTAHDDGPQPETARAEAVQSLFAGGPLRLFIRHGRFLEAAGFEISDDGRVAILKDDVEDETVKAADGIDVIRLSLTWTDVEAAATTQPGGRAEGGVRDPR